MERTYSRTRWTVAALVTTVLFVPAHLLVALLTGLSCSGDGGSPYAAPASPYGRYCDALDSHGDLMWWLLIGVPIAVVVVLFGVGIVRRSFRVSIAAIAAAVGALAIAFGAVVALPDTCAGDDQSRPGCSHY